MRRTCLTVLAFCFGVMSSAHALELREGMFEVGPYGGYQFLDDFGGLSPDNNFLYGVRAGYFLTESTSFESSYQINFTGSAGPDARFSSLRFNLLYNFLNAMRVNPFVTGGLGWFQVKLDGADAANELGVNLGAGVRVLLTDMLALRLDGRYLYAEVESLRQHNYETSLGLSFLLGGAPSQDSDGDGVKDARDKCPGTPAGATVDARGCPSDADGDGVFDGIDQCPGTFKGFLVDDKGCPMDSDNDGVPDGPDQCPNTPKGARVDAKGCSADADQDGVEDGLDQCPNTAQGVKVDDKGCPLDSDGDGVADHMDQCPETPADTKVDAKGCPLETKSRGVLLGVTFKTGSAELEPNSLTILDMVAKELNEFPQVRVEVQGHTDSTGSAEGNLLISTKRAKTVEEYLVAKGVSAQRLISKGYGPDLPIASNKTPEGRAQNRRVELKWLD